MRVLYVALTRAREKLIVFATYSDARARIEKLRRSLSMPLAPEILEGAASMGDWMLMAALMRPEACAILENTPFENEMGVKFPWDIKFAALGYGETAEKEDEKTQKITSSKTAEQIKEILDFRYPYSKNFLVPSKVTATELKGLVADRESNEDAGSIIKKEKPQMRKPDFESADRPLTGAQRGTALHLAMQFIDYEKCTSLEGINEEISRLENMRILTNKQAQAVPVWKILKLFTSETGKMILTADEVRREFKFSMLVKAGEFFDAAGDDEILLQGVTDCIVKKSGKSYIIDYKTDKVNDDTVMDRAEFYRGQIEAYKKAIGEISGIKPEKAGLYFFAIDKIIWI